MPAPVAASRVQLTPQVGFEEVIGRLGHLQALGITHIYLSPVTEAVPGSTHGYDVVDHTLVRDELGGADGLIALLGAAADHRMGVVIDHVANHASVGRPELNGRWWQMLRDGPGSPAARWFDVDWGTAGGKVLLAVLGEPLDDVIASGDLRTVDGPGGAELRLDEQRWPLAPGTGRLALVDLLDRQHYRLQHWRDPARNVRRFFTIDDLVAVRVEHPEVAAAVDTVPRLIAEHPGFAGVRVDHIDGLADPGTYLEGLRRTIGDRWLLVEKILAPRELVPIGWPVDGTTGYEHARVAEHALLDRAGFDVLRERWWQAVGDDRPFAAWELEARREVLAAGLAPDARRVAAAVDDELAPAVAEVSAHLHRYRTYLPDDPPGRDALDVALDDARTGRPDLRDVLGRLERILLAPGDTTEVELRTRWQQLTGPAVAKGDEDRAFFRYLPLSTLCEVGGQPEPDPGTDAVEELHRHHGTAQHHWPGTMLAGTTHDNKRSEDVRARGLALAAAADRWVEVVDAWHAAPAARHPDVDAAMHWLALQTVATAGPLVADRLTAFLIKAAREADRRTAWTDQDVRYEQALASLGAAVAGWGPVGDLTDAIDRRGRAASLALLAMRCTAPGVPDVYQGTEAFRFLLVDPDNRVEPDQARLTEIVERVSGLDAAAAWAEPGAPAARAVVLTRLLHLRRSIPDVFGTGGGYQPLTADGADADAHLAFSRLDGDSIARIVTAVRRVVGSDTGGGATLTLPPGRWRHVLVDGLEPVEATLDLGHALDAFPAVVLASTDGD